MAEARDRSVVRWGEELRRHRAGRVSRRRRTGLTAVAAALVTVLVATLIWPPRAALVWNASASSPMGLYRVTDPGGISAGDMVVAWAPDWARRIAAERRYVPLNVPLVKRVAAARGDRVCVVGEAVFVNGQMVARRRSTDRAGRRLPWWTGCEDLGEGDLFLLMPAADSFDGRYFGISRHLDVVGRARLIWPI